MTKVMSQKSYDGSENIPRIALIGCGAIAEQYYLPALARIPSVLSKLVLVDCEQERAKLLANQFSVKTFIKDYMQVLGAVDGVILAVPTHLHYPIAKNFLSHGVHVLSEKPLAESLDKAKELVSIACENDVILAVNYLQRLIPTFAKVKELLTRMEFGKPISIKYSVGEEFGWPTVSGFYFNSPISSRGVLRDRGAHVIDHICWWLEGKPHLISSRNDSFGGSEAVVHINFEKGRCQGEIKLSWLTSFPCKFIIQCERGVISGDVYDYNNIFLKPENGQERRVKLKSKEKTKVDIGYKIIQDFINVFSKGKTPLISGNDVLDSIEFIDECYAAAVPFEMSWYKFSEVMHG